MAIYYNYIANLLEIKSEFQLSCIAFNDNNKRQLMHIKINIDVINIHGKI